MRIGARHPGGSQPKPPSGRDMGTVVAGPFWAEEKISPPGPNPQKKEKKVQVRSLVVNPLKGHADKATNLPISAKFCPRIQSPS